MTENRSNWSPVQQGRSTKQNQAAPQRDTPQNKTSSENPVINEFFDSDSPGEIFSRGIPKRSSAQPPQQEPHETGAAADEADNTGFIQGKRLFRMDRWEDAIKELLSVKNESLSDEEQMDLAYYLGLCCTKLERYDEALPHLEQVIGSGGEPLRIYQCRMTLAYIYIITDRAGMAEAELERLQAGGLESAMLYNTMAYAAYAQKRYLGAVELYEKALDIDDENATAMNSLGYILADTGLDKFRGLRLCRKALEKNPGNAAYLDSLGWAHYKCGKLAEARSLLRRAMDIAPQEQEIRKHYTVVGGGPA